MIKSWKSGSCDKGIVGFWCFFELGFGVLMGWRFGLMLDNVISCVLGSFVGEGDVELFDSGLWTKVV